MVTIPARAWYGVCFGVAMALERACGKEEAMVRKLILALVVVVMAAVPVLALARGGYEERPRC